MKLAYSRRPIADLNEISRVLFKQSKPEDSAIDLNAASST
jgi:hypothetical protein